MIFSTPTNSVIICATDDQSFANRMSYAAKLIEAETYSSSKFEETVSASRQYFSRCLIVDFDYWCREQVHLTDRSIARETPLLIATPSGDINAAFIAGAAGAMGNFEKGIDPTELGLLFQAALLSEQTLRETQPYDNPTFKILSTREKDVLTYLMAGEPNKRVASLLDIGLRTVESDRAQLMSKLKVNSFTELVKMVTEIENDLILTRQKIFCEISIGMTSSNVAVTGD